MIMAIESRHIVPDDFTSPQYRVQPDRPCPVCGKPDYCLTDWAVWAICNRHESGTPYARGWLHRLGEGTDARQHSDHAMPGDARNVASATPKAATPKFWPDPATAESESAKLPRVVDDPEAVEFFRREYGLEPGMIPAIDWRVFENPRFGNGVVYPGLDKNGSRVYKFKSYKRDAHGKRKIIYLHGAGGALAFPGKRGLVIVAGEEKSVAAHAAGYAVVSSMTGEAALAPEWIASIVAIEPRPARIVLANDNDEAGEKSNISSARLFEIAGIPASSIFIIKWPNDAPSGFDLNDLLKSGGIQAVRDAIDDAPAYKSTLLPEIICARALQNKTFIPPRFIISEIRPEGLSLIASKPKKGKSWLELQASISIATGAIALGKFPTTCGDVLYVALEDSPSRMQSRMAALVGNAAWPEKLHFAHSWPRLDKGGLEALRVWLRQHPGAAEVVLDTFTRIRPPKSRGGDSYQEDCDATATLQRLALEFHVAVVLVLHQRKAASDDPFDSVSGTLGMTASADAVGILTRSPDGGAGELVLTGRDIEEKCLAFQFLAGRWTYTGEVEDAGANDPREAARAFLREALASGPVDSAQLFADGAAQGISRHYVYDARDALHVTIRKGGFQGKYSWSLSC
jgi:hypothetical protein